MIVRRDHDWDFLQTGRRLISRLTVVVLEYRDRQDFAQALQYLLTICDLERDVDLDNGETDRANAAQNI